MHHRLKLTVAALLLTACWSCGSLLLPEKERLLTEGRYSETERLIESGGTDVGSVNSPDLAMICYSYSKLKKYNKLFSCIDRLEGNISSGDKRGYEKMIVGGTIGTFPIDDISALPSLLKAEAFIELGDYGRAVYFAQRAYEIITRTNWSNIDSFQNWPRRYNIRCLGLLTLAHVLSGDRQKALSYLEKLENADIGFVGMLPIKKEKNLALARSYMAFCEYEKVLSMNEAGLDFMASLGSFIVGPDTMKSYLANIDMSKQFMISKSLFETGHFREAKQGYEKLLVQANVKDSGGIYWDILSDRGTLAQREGKAAEAIKCYQEAIDIIEKQRSTINTEAAKIGFVGDKQKVYHQIIAALYENNRFAEAFEYVERSKSRALVDLLASKQEFGVPSASGIQIKSALRYMKAVEQENQSLDMSNMSIDKVNQRNLRSLEIKKKLEEGTPELAALVTVSKVDIKEIQKLLKRDETLIEYYYSGNDLYAFILTISDLKAVKLNGTNLLYEIDKLRKSIEDANSMKYMNASGNLYNRLLKPINQEIKTSKLIIVPHGALHYLPFTALQHNGKFLIDQYTISHLPSASLLKFFKAREHQKDKKVLLIGNPDLGSPQYDLKYAEQEALTISKLYPHSRLYLRDKATKSTFLREAPNYGYIHLATHGIFNEDSPLNSGIFFSSDGNTDGFLSVNELFSLNLNSDLVTLSACETGLGKVSNGDDVVGFIRGFLYAGTNYVVSSLWKVDDLATSFLMTEFYSNLKTMTKQEAMRQAQLATKKKYENPYYWAAFQLTGKGD